MPTDPNRRRPAEDDDAYVVDTRASKRPAPRSRRAPVEDDAYVVDTRTSAPPRKPPRTVRRAGAGGAASGSRPAPPSGPPPDRPTGAPPRTRLRKGRITLLVVALVIIAWLAFMIWVPVSAWNNVARVDNLPGGQRPTDTSGHNYLLVGSDSREGLTKAQRKQLATGNAQGKRTDTIMLVHVSESGGKPVVISIPRDSYVPIPGYGSNKINASFAFGGPKLLTETVEQVTGIHVDGYLEIGLGGFASVVDSLGGVNICVPRDMKDKLAGIDLKKGCQVLSGPEALGYVRSRHEDPLGDIGRANRQRQFLSALIKQAATPSTVLIPWRYKSFVDSAAGGVIVGKETSLMDAYRILTAMRAVSNDEGLSLTVPIADMALPTSNAGVAVKWDTERARSLFTSLKKDEPLTEPPAGTTPGQKG